MRSLALTSCFGLVFAVLAQSITITIGSDQDGSTVAWSSDDTDCARALIAPAAVITCGDVFILDGTLYQMGACNEATQTVSALDGSATYSCQSAGDVLNQCGFREEYICS